MLTSKTKIRLSLLLVASVSLVTSLLSLNYMNQMVRKIEVMTESDAKMAEIGEELSIRMLEARREEKNFIIFLDSTHIQQSMQILESMDKEASLARSVSPLYHTELDSIAKLISSYRNSLQSLAQTFQDDPRAFYRLQQQVMEYEKELKHITEQEQISSKELPGWATILNYSLLNAANKISSDKAKVISELKETSTQILILTESIAESARESLARNSKEGRQYGVRARRNILTLLMITGLLLAALIFYLPMKIFEPFRKIQRALSAISRGETEFPMPNMDSKDEIGTLSRSFHEATRKIRFFNNLITEKVVETRRNYQRILDEVDEGVIIATTDLNVIFINQTIREWFHLKTKTEIKSVQDIGPLWSQIGSALENIEKMGRTELDMQNGTDYPEMHKVTVIPRPGKSGRTETVLFIIRQSKEHERG